MLLPSNPSNLRDTWKYMTSRDYIAVHVNSMSEIHNVDLNYRANAISVRRVHVTSVSTCMRGWA